MKNLTGRFISKDEIHIFYRIWLPDEYFSVVLALHGLGLHSGYFENMAYYFSKHNIATFAIDLRGFGFSQFPLNKLYSFYPYLEDINQLLQIIKTTSLIKPIFLLGESFGGLIALFYAAKFQNNNLTGLILCSPALRPRINLTLFLKIIVSIYKKPSAEVFFPHSADQYCSDIEFVKKIKSDYLCKNSIPLTFGKLMWQLQRSAFHLASKITLPVLVLQSKRDAIINPRGSFAVFKKISSTCKYYRSFSQSKHSLLNDIDRENVYKLIIDWIKTIRTLTPQHFRE